MLEYIFINIKAVEVNVLETHKQNRLSMCINLDTKVVRFSKMKSLFQVSKYFALGAMCQLGLTVQRLA